LSGERVRDTAITVAERLKRRWIGIDVNYLAINLAQRRLR